jgi:hypothetical protein
LGFAVMSNPTLCVLLVVIPCDFPADCDDSFRLHKVTAA